MLVNEIKSNIPTEKDKQVVDDLMDELENLGAKAKVKPDQSIKDEDEDDYKKRKKHRHRSPDSKYDRKKSRYALSSSISSYSKLSL